MENRGIYYNGVSWRPRVGSSQGLQGLGLGTGEVAGTGELPPSLLSLASHILHLHSFAPLSPHQLFLPLGTRDREWLPGNSQALY